MSRFSRTALLPTAQVASRVVQPPVPSLPDVHVAVEPISVSLEDAAKLVGVSLWTIREAVMTGKLAAKKAGRQHVIPLMELRRWVVALEDVEPSTAPSLVKRAKE